METYSGHILIEMRKIFNHLNGILKLTHGFSKYYRFDNSGYSAQGVSAELTDTTTGQVYTITITPKRPTDTRYPKETL